MAWSLAGLLGGDGKMEMELYGRLNIGKTGIYCFSQTQDGAPMYGRMLKIVADLAYKAGLKCWVSLETPMACGMGICFTCVTKCKDETAPEGWDYCRTCVEGPVFDAEKLIW